MRLRILFVKWIFVGIEQYYHRKRVSVEFYSLLLRCIYSLSLRGWPIELHQIQWEINETEHVPFFRFGSCSLLLFLYLLHIALVAFSSLRLLSILKRFFHSAHLGTVHAPNVRFAVLFLHSITKWEYST